MELVAAGVLSELTRRREKPSEHKMGGIVEDDNQAKEHQRQMHRGWAKAAMEDGIGESVVEILHRSPEARQHKESSRDPGLPAQCPAVITDPPEPGKDYGGKDHMEEREQAHPQREAGVPHVFRA